MEQVLRNAVDREPLIEMYTGLQVAGLASPAAPRVTVTDAAGANREVKTDWAVACDGGSSALRKSLGIRLQGTSAPRPNFNVVFRSRELGDRLTLDPAVQYWIVGEVSGMLGRLDLDDLWWTIVQGVDPADCDDPAGLVQRMAGATFDVEVVATDPWTARMLLAPTYREGNVFLVGDAAHLNPPWGGHGFNTCVVDALNLSWKVAAAIKGWAGPGLLDSYGGERRDVARWMIDVAANNGQALAYSFVDEALADPGLLGDQARSRVGEALAVKEAEFHAEGLVLGYHYAGSPLNTSDGSEPPAADAITYRPSASPGCLLPHFWLEDGRSVYDLLGLDFTLLAGGEVSLMAAPGLGYVDVVQISEQDRARALEMWNASFVLVRPDGHVAWRGNDLDGWLPALHRAAGEPSSA